MTTEVSAKDRLWLNPSKAYLLEECHLRWVSESSSQEYDGEHTAAVKRSIAQEFGLDMHRLLEFWVQRNCFQTGESIRDIFDEFRNSIDGSVKVDARLMVKRSATFRTIDSYLSQFINSNFVNPTVNAEENLRNVDFRVRGKCDLLIEDESQSCILDLKTGKSQHEKEMNQLLIYLSLLKSDRDIVSCGVIRPGEQIHTQIISPKDYNHHLEKMLQLKSQAEELKVATTGSTFCGCPLRPKCDVHWTAVSLGEIETAIRGEISSIETSNSNMALGIQSDLGKVLITNLPLKKLEIGKQVSVLEIQKVSESVYRGSMHSRIQD